MKKLTLDQAWVRCMKVLNFSEKLLKSGKAKDIHDAKRQAMNKYYPYDIIYLNCWFCEYQHQGNKSCYEGGCPATLIDKTFDCTSHCYDYEDRPFEFISVVRRLYKKYRDQKKGTK